MSTINTLKGILKMKVQRLQRELQELQDGDSLLEHPKYTKLLTQISTLKETIDIIDTL
jgi:hypothetical protein